MKGWTKDELRVVAWMKNGWINVMHLDNIDHCLEAIR